MSRYFDERGLTRPRLLAGSIGADARAMGGALLPLYAHFAPNRELFLTTEAAQRLSECLERRMDTCSQAMLALSRRLRSDPILKLYFRNPGKFSGIVGH